MRRFLVLFTFSIISIVATSALAKESANRTPACAHGKMIECRTGYHPSSHNGCSECVANHLTAVPADKHPADCKKILNFQCTMDHEAIKDEKGCWHCAVREVTPPTCDKSGEGECPTGYHPAKDPNGCFQCVE